MFIKKQLTGIGMIRLFSKKKTLWLLWLCLGIYWFICFN